MLLDASYSMRAAGSGVSRWDRSVDLAKKMFHSLGEGDRSSLVVFADEVLHSSGYLANRHQELARSLAGFSPTYRSTRGLPALKAAYALLAHSPAPNKGILILSDMARNGWEGGGRSWADEIEGYDPKVQILLPGPEEVPENAAVERMELAGDLNSGLLRVQAELRNYGRRPLLQLPVSLDFFGPGGSPVRQSQVLVDLEPGERRTVALGAPFPPGAEVRGRVKLRADALPVDDDFYFSRPVPQKIRVLAVEEPSGIQALSGESYYLRQALLAPPSPFEVTTVTLAQLPRTDLSAYDVLALVNPGPFAPEVLAALRAALARGGALVLTLGGRTSSGRDSWSLDWPCRMMAERPAASEKVSVNPELAGTVLKDFASAYEWDKVRLDRIVQPVIRDGAEPWLLLSDGTPALILSEDRRVAVWTSSIDRSWTNLPSKPVFVPLARFLFETVSGKSRSSGRPEARAGAAYRAALDSFQGRRPEELISPDGDRIPVRLSRDEIAAPPLELQGFYTPSGGRGAPGREAALAVNADRESGEGDLSRAEDDELEALLPGSRRVAVAGGPGFVDSVVAALRGNELGRTFLVIAAFLLLGEMLLSRRKA
ncbi:MAG: hypothetical protein A2902_01290 [Elusimicrobia bacterium RIFCSPLOWO2_01_FULL_64_13]|nr:MAG: hypothetical protein A2902_01290 [Elusimicrobia bacterium RIFCSPLOWO2_01_FULL_64_13]